MSVLQAYKNKIMWDVDNLEKWDRPQVLINYCPHGTTGFDNEGSPSNIIIKITQIY